MSGKLAWTIGFVLAFLGLALFGWGYMSQNTSDLEKASGALKASSPNEATVAKAAEERKDKPAELKAWQNVIRAIAGEGGAWNGHDWKVSGDFLGQQWPKIRTELLDYAKKVENGKGPPAWMLTGALIVEELKIRPGEYGAMQNLNKIILDNPLFNAKNGDKDGQVVGKLAATCVYEVVRICEELHQRSPNAVLQFNDFNFSPGSDSKFEPPAPGYGVADPYVRRNFDVEFTADPAFIAEFLQTVQKRREGRPVFRIIGTTLSPFPPPRGTVESMTFQQIGEFLGSLPDTAKAELKQPLPAAEKDLQAWLDSTDNLAVGKPQLTNKQVLQKIVNAQPERFRVAMPSRLKVTLQLLDAKELKDAPLLDPKSVEPQN